MEWLLYPPIYFGIKFAAYLSWCRFGIRLMAQDEQRPMRRSVLLALLRMAMGLVLGWLLLLPMMWAFPGQNRIGFKLPQYVIALILLRWIEWSVISVVLRHAKPSQLFTIRSGNDFLWRAGGLVVSFASDAAMILSVGAAGLIPC